MATAIVTWWGALLGLALAIILILKKLNPVYALFIGAVVGALIGGANFVQTTSLVITGTQSVMGTVVRVIAAGLLAGVMMESGAAETLARTVVNKLGEHLAIFAITLAVMIITAVGVFIPVAILIVAPIALEIGHRMGISKLALLVALSGGGKAGNLISPNPNTIAAAKGFGLDMSHLMIADFIPALFGLFAATFIAMMLKNKGDKVLDADIIDDSETDTSHLPSLKSSLVTPILAVVLLLINPIGQILHIKLLANIQLDAMFVLPIAATVGAIAMGKAKELKRFAQAGMSRMTDVVLILIGAGFISGLITASNLPAVMVDLIKTSGVSGTFLAPIAGIAMGAASASTSTGVILATGSFSKAILSMGVNPLTAAVLVHIGAMLIDHLPHGNYFHVTANAMHMTIGQRMKSVGYETLVVTVMMVAAYVMYVVF
ncbi:GntP family permease [Weissella confusa]|uniref:GntP family permease n=1 Tax=Weissella confusa TaxID=1583 RepID=UPI00223C278A|nr:Na+/H+ antiporter NhaC family protein [Weissella confusa]MCT0014008.1 GntP family permease [Weissella confusa]